jgi:agmatine deiminase
MTRRHPAEWEPQAATWLAWPHNAQNWGHRPEIIDFYASLAARIAQYQPCHILVPPHARASFEQAPLPRHTPFAIAPFFIPTDDIWVRDYGPFFVADGPHRRIVSFAFNAWGEKFPPYDTDNQVPARIAAQLGWPIESHDFILEGGAIEFDGLGTALTTAPCLVGEARNPIEQKTALQNAICTAFGLDDLLVLPFGLEGDHTDGHIDNLVRFVAPGHLVLNADCDVHSENHERLREIKDRLQFWMRRRSERGWRLDEVPLPTQRQLGDETLPANHLNFIFVNGALLVPRYGEDTDDEALRILSRALPHLRTEGVDCRLVIEEGGSLHCLSRQQPRLP